MNLQDVIDIEYGLCQDDYSQSGVVFGEDGQLEVFGWSGRNGSGNKYYILKCNKCSQDPELFGEGYFSNAKSGLVKGEVPCGCGKSPRWTEGQYCVICSRKSKEMGYTFLGFEGVWDNQRTKLILRCEKHGEWNSTNINNLINIGRGCPGCKVDALREAKLKPDAIMLASFFSSEAFHPDTKFWRSERKNSQGCKSYWYMSCPECGQQGESFSGDLQKGQRPCACSDQRQQEAYINWIVDDNNMAVAIKFGIARDSKQRIKQQNAKSAYTIQQHSVYTFLDVASCKKAERECKQELECGVVLKKDMPDGYTETTWLHNIDIVKSIYERNGGVVAKA